MKGKCYTCKYRGGIFRLPSGNHCHCEHPSMEALSRKNPFNTLMMIFESCGKYEKANKKAVRNEKDNL